MCSRHVFVPFVIIYSSCVSKSFTSQSSKKKEVVLYGDKVELYWPVEPVATQYHSTVLCAALVTTWSFDVMLCYAVTLCDTYTGCGKSVCVTATGLNYTAVTGYTTVFTFSSHAVVTITMWAREEWMNIQPAHKVHVNQLALEKEWNNTEPPIY